MKRIITFIMASIIVVTALPLTAFAEGTEETTSADNFMMAADASGEEAAEYDNAADTACETDITDEEEFAEKTCACGEDLTWRYEAGILYIDGTGDMYDFSSQTEVPWNGYCTAIIAIELDDGVTGIGSYAFRGCIGLSNYTVPDSIDRIGDFAFDANIRLLGRIGSAVESFCTQNGNPFSALVSEPRLVSVADSADGVLVKWDPVENARLYRIYRKTASADWTVLADTEYCTYSDGMVKSGVNYTYTVQCLSEDGSIETSTYDTVGKSVTHVAATALFSITAANGGVHMTWKKVTGASGYRIFRRIEGGKWTRIGDSPGTAYTDRTAEKGIVYYYALRGMDVRGNYVTSYDPDGKAFTLSETPILSGVSSVFGGVRLTWGQVEGTSSYCIYRKSAGGSWVWIGQTSLESYTDTKVISGARYSYTVRCLGTDGSPMSEYDPVGMSILYVAAPEIVSISAVSGGTHLTWRKVNGASKYRVFRKTDSGNWMRIGDAASTSFTDRKAEKGIGYVYTVRCVDADGNYVSSYDPVGTPFTLAPAPILSSVANIDGGVRITWEKVNGADKYRIYRKTEDGSWGRIGETAASSYADRTAVSGVRYSYTVRCLNGENTLISDYDPVGQHIVYVAAPRIVSLSAVNGGVHVTWGSVNGASKYRVFRKNDSGNWVRIGDTAAVSYTDASVVFGATYCYTVRCIDADGNYVSSYDSGGKMITYAAAPSISNISASNGGVRIVWGQIDGAAEYRVYRKTGSGSWSVIEETTAASYTDRTAEYGVAYSYTVGCVDSFGNLCSVYDPVGKKLSLTETPVLSGVANVDGGVSVSWMRSDGAEKYRVFRKSGGGTWGRIGDTTGTVFVDATAVSGVAYTYTVRCVNSADDYCSSYDLTGRTITYYEAPVIDSMYYVENGVCIIWGAVTEAAGYRVFRRASGEGWKSIGDTTDNAFIDTTALIGTTYSYTVCCLDASGDPVSAYKEEGKTLYFKKIYLSPSNQDANTFITGNANEGEVWNDIAARLVNLLAAYDCEVLLADYDMVLDDRAEEAKQWGADVYVAMHSNAYVRPNSCWGVEVYYDANKSDSAEREALATALLNELSTLFINRGLRTTSYLKECRLPEMPSVIVECGYHDSVSDANLILNNKDRIAQLYCNALVSYLGLVKRP